MRREIPYADPTLTVGRHYDGAAPTLLDCSRCRRQLPAAEFPQNRYNPNRGYRDHYCRTCMREKARAWRAQQKATRGEEWTEHRRIEKAKSRAAVRSRRAPAMRRCAICEKQLSRYNASPLCFYCQEV